jgi:hypothetical protein
MSEIEVAEMVEDDIETRIWEQFVRKRGSETKFKAKEERYNNSRS